MQKSAIIRGNLVYLISHCQCLTEKMFMHNIYTTTNKNKISSLYNIYTTNYKKKSLVYTVHANSNGISKALPDNKQEIICS